MYRWNCNKIIGNIECRLDILKAREYIKEYAKHHIEYKFSVKSSFSVYLKFVKSSFSVYLKLLESGNLDGNLDGYN